MAKSSLGNVRAFLAGRWDPLTRVDQDVTQDLQQVFGRC